MKVSVRVISRSRRQRFITLTETLIIPDIRKPNLIIVLLYIERILLVSRFDTKCFQSLCQLFLFLRLYQFFLFHIISKQLLCHLRRAFNVLWVPVFKYFFRCLAQSTKQTWKSCFCFFTDGKQHKARELDMITLRNQAPRSCITWLPVTLSVLDMIIG